MNEALRKKLRDFVTCCVILIGAYWVLPELWDQISLHSYQLGGWRFILYFIVICLYLALISFGLIFAITEGFWLLKEIIHFLGVIWKSIVHGEIQSYTSLVSQNAMELAELQRRNQQRKDFISQEMNIEQRTLFQNAYNEFYKKGFDLGTREGESIGYTDGYRNNMRLDTIVKRLESGENYERIS